MRARLALSLAILAAAPAARGFDWPGARRGVAQADPLAGFRWASIDAWQSTAQVTVRAALARLDASGDDGARVHAARAVLLRLMRRDDDARAALRRALSLSPDGAVLEDPDVALTGAYLAARAGDFASATSLGERGLARMPAVPPQRGVLRDALVLEVARWSMARGPDGLDDAVRLLRAFVAVAPATPMVRATLALALARRGEIDEARLVADGARATLQPGDGDALLRGAVDTGDGPAAAGVALALVGRAGDAVAPLERATRAVVPPWRAFQQAQLASARRLAPSGAGGAR